MSIEEQIQNLVSNFEQKSKEIAGNISSLADDAEREGDVLQDNKTIEPKSTYFQK